MVFCIVFGILCICICIDIVCMCGLHILHCTAWYGVVLYCTYRVLCCILCHGIYGMYEFVLCAQHCLLFIGLQDTLFCMQ